MATYTVTNQQVSTLHNGFLYLRNALESAKDTLNPNSSIVQALEKSLKTLQPLRDELVGTQDRLWNEQNDYFFKVQKDNQFQSIWSIYTYDDFKFEDKHNLPIGASFVCYDVPVADQRFKVEGDTWFDVWKTVDAFLRQYSDEVGNHLFIEGFNVKDNSVYISLGS
jgi:hypothetical protein